MCGSRPANAPLPPLNIGKAVLEMAKKARARAAGWRWRRIV